MSLKNKAKLTAAAIAAALGIAAPSLEAQAKQPECPRDFPPLMIVRVEGSGTLHYVGLEHVYIQDSEGNVDGIRSVDKVITFEKNPLLEWLREYVIKKALECNMIRESTTERIVYLITAESGAGEIYSAELIIHRKDLYPDGRLYDIPPLDSLVVRHPSGAKLIDGGLSGRVYNEADQPKYAEALKSFERTYNKPKNFTKPQKKP